MKQLLLGSLLLLALASGALAQQPDRALRSLQGIRELRVVVESLHTSSSTAGITAFQLQIDVELRLRELGITVVPPTSSAEPPWLYLKVTTRQGPDRGYAVSIELSLHDWVRVVRDTTITLWAATWAASGRSGYTTGNEPARGIRDAVKDLVDEFANDYLAANPRR